MQTTRLHISGLTPSITQNDLKQRFSTFGEVKDVDGVGKLDGLGQPRKFAYVTLESTQAKLSRCMNLLSGSTWKGAKLRIGEAKPDYRARHEAEINPLPPAPRRKLDALGLKRARLKRRLRARRLIRGVQGREAKDMRLVTVENAASRKGWRTTPLGHLIRPLRMRPLHPIPLPPKRVQPSKKPRLKKAGKKEKERKKRVFRLTRARCTVIDPARYGVVHVVAGKGGLGDELLLGGGVEVERGVEVQEVQTEVADEVSSTISSGEESAPNATTRALSQRSPTPIPASPPPAVSNPPAAALAKPVDDGGISLAKEKADTLALLGGLFSGRDEWEGRESVSGDEGIGGVDVAEADDVDYQVVPKEGGGSALAAEEEMGVQEEAEAGDIEESEGEAVDQEDVNMDEKSEAAESDSEEPNDAVQHNALKDMFKPQEESGGFTFGLDIELDPDAESFLPASLSELSQPAPVSVLVTQTTAQAHTIQFTPDPRAMMFFPTFGGSKKDVFSVIAEKGWKWPHSGTSEEIRAKWDKDKAELTREYTRRHREAVKRRRRGGVVRGEEV